MNACVIKFNMTGVRQFAKLTLVIRLQKLTGPAIGGAPAGAPFSICRVVEQSKIGLTSTISMEISFSESASDSMAKKLHEQLVHYEQQYRCPEPLADLKHQYQN